MESPASPEGPPTRAPDPPTPSHAPPLTRPPGPDDRPRTDPGEVPVPGFEIRMVLGRGGMGVVYQAQHLRLNRLVALKMMLHAEHAGAEVHRRFQAEAEAVARLQHPNIVQIYEVGVAAGRPYFALEFMAGGSLAQRLNKTPLPPLEAAQLVETLARAVQFAHDKGVLHRDLKPANVLLSAELGVRNSERNETDNSEFRAPSSALRVPKIADFGLAKRLDDDSGQTRTGAVVGTPSYMAPEQAAGQTRLIGPAVDIYALGAILYECLTGKPPFRAATVLDTLEQVRTREPVPPRTLQPAVRRDLDTICLKCLRKDPARRYATAGQLADDLRRFQDGEPIRARPTPRWERGLLWVRRNRWRAAGLAATFLLLLLTAAGSPYLYFKNVKLSETSADLEDKNGKLGKANVDLGKANDELGKTNGKLGKANIDLDRAKADSDRELVRSKANNGLQRMNEGTAILALPYLADGLRILKEKGLRDDALEQLLRARFGAVLQQCPRPLQVWSQDGNVVHAEFSPDGRRVLTVGSDGAARLWDLSEASPAGALLTHKGPATCAAFRPDGKRIVTGGPNGAVMVWDAVTRKEIGTKVLGFGLPVLHVAFSPNGRLVLAAGGNRYSRGRTVTSPPTVIITGPGRTTTIPGVPMPQEEIGVAQVWDAATGREVQFMPAGGWVNHASFSPDSGRVVTASASAGGMHMARIWEVGLPQSVRVVGLAAAGPLHALPLLHLTSLLSRQAWMDHHRYVHQASFSPDGRRVVTASGQAGPMGRNEAQIWDALSGQRVGPPLRHDKTVTLASFSPDGHRVLTGSDDFAAQIWDAHTSEPRSPRLAHNDKVTAASFSPDGLLVLTASLDGTVRLWDGMTGDPALPPLPHGRAVLSASFSADGKRLLVGCEGGLVRLWDLAAARARLPVLRHASQATFAAYTPAGRLLTMTGGDVVRTHSGTVEPDERALVTNRQVLAWDLTRGEVVQGPQPHTGSAGQGFLSPGGERVLTEVTGGVPRNVAKFGIWEPGSGAFHPLDGLSKARPLWAGFASDGRCLAVLAATEGRVPNVTWRVTVLDAESGKVVAGPWGHDTGLAGAALFPDGSKLATLTVRQGAPPRAGAVVPPEVEIDIWDTHTGKLLQGPWKRSRSAARIDFSPGGRHMALSDPAGVWLWNTDTGARVELKPAGGVGRVAFSPDERLVVTASANRTARVWDAETGKEVSPLLEHRGQVTFAAFSPDGLHVVTASDDRTARVWQARTGEPLTPPLHHAGAVVHACFRPDGKEVATASHDRTARIWKLPAEAGSVEDLIGLAHLLSSHRLEEKGGLAALEAPALLGAWQGLRDGYLKALDPSRP